MRILIRMLHSSLSRITMAAPFSLAGANMRRRLSFAPLLHSSILSSRRQLAVTTRIVSMPCEESAR